MKFTISFVLYAIALTTALPNPYGYFPKSTNPTDTTLQGRAQPSTSAQYGRALSSSAPILPRYVSLNTTANTTTSLNSTAVETPSLSHTTVLKRPTYSRGNLTTTYFSRLRALRLQKIHEAQASNITVTASNSTFLDRSKVTNSTATYNTTESQPSASTSPDFRATIL
jgi:hypothetical protein